jgi:transposase
VLGLFLSRLEVIESHMEILDKSIATALASFQDAVVRLAQVPGFGLDSAQQVIAEVGATAEAFPSPEQLSSWVGVCPGREESAEVSKTDRSPKGNRVMRRVLTQVANAAVKTEDSLFQALYRKLLWKGHNKAIWAVAHRLCRLTWKILHQGVSYIEYGARLNPKALQRRTTKLVRELRQLGYQVQLGPLQPKATG